ncbi:hypothetical protein J2797_005557 [Paraburkholderia terricola]|uniref:hypothetical protein n=1 Tax=Paraburkholderia terricola TaxID=169427 RepID=UPI002865F1C6|nr:hypothetical protein [Paraburkholderia terricola]MDR6495633.1 hypothetical protein [Paraburkholderia terricola]
MEFEYDKHTRVARYAYALIALALYGCLAVASQAGFSADQYINIKIGDERLQRVVTFTVPKVYAPQFNENFFRLVVDYPSMQPTIGPKEYKLDDDSLAIVVEAYPKNGTMADSVVEGIYGAKKIGSQDGYTIYSEPLGKSAPTKGFAYEDAQNNNVAVRDPGAWSIRYEITHGIKPYYLIKCSFSKNLNIPFRDIDDAASKFIASMFTK